MMDIGKDLQSAYDDGYKQRDSEIVRCKDCRHYRPIGKATGICAINDIEHRLFADWFCADGERRSE